MFRIYKRSNTALKIKQKTTTSALFVSKMNQTARRERESKTNGTARAARHASRSLPLNDLDPPISPNRI